MIDRTSHYRICSDRVAVGWRSDLLRVFCDERTDLGDEHGGRTLSKDSGIWAPETVDALFENVLMVWFVVGALKRGTGFELHSGPLEGSLYF